MTAQNKDALKALFQTGSTITQTSMANLIDSFIDTIETSAQSIASPMTFNGATTFNGAVAFTSAVSYGTPLGVASGGTGLTDISAYAILVGNNTSTPSLVSPSSTSGIPLISQGVSANPTYGTAAVAGGGTGQTSYTDGQLLIGNTATGGLSKATLTPGTNVTITNAGGSITIAASTGGSTGVLLHTFAASSSSAITWNNVYVTGTYDNYRIIANNISGSTSIDLLIDFAVSGTYGSNGWSVGHTLNIVSPTTGSTNPPPLTTSTVIDTNKATRCFIDLTGLTSGVQASFNSVVNAGTNIIQAWGTISGTNVCNGIKITPSTGNIATGTFSLYGIPS